MDNIFFLAALFFIAVVVFSLLAGLFAMARGNEKDHKISQRMMRLRVVAQGLALVFLLLAYLTKQ